MTGGHCETGKEERRGEGKGMVRRKDNESGQREGRPCTWRERGKAGSQWDS